MDQKLCKAFDIPNHKPLPAKLIAYGLDNKIYSMWFK